MSQFSNLRGEMRALESECDKDLTELSNLVQNPADSAELEAKIDANLKERSTRIQESFTLAYEPNVSPAWLHQTQRHAELLEDNKRAAKQSRSAVSQERSRRTLLSSVRQDIQTHRLGGRTNGASSAEASGDADAYYGDEMNRVNQSHSVVDTSLATAYEARAELMNQQNTLHDVQRRLFRAASQVPGINTLIAKINTRQKRNSLVLATVLVLCVLFIIFVR